MSITKTAMLVTVSITTWSGRKLDREITDETNRQHGASMDAGRYNKALISTDALAEITAASNRARREHYARTLPWLDNGTRILSAQAFPEYSAKIRTESDAFNAAVETFLGNYDAYVDAARIRLNGMFKAQDYPAASDIARRFSFERKLWPIPDAGDFRVTMGAGEQEAIRSEIQANLERALNEAMRDAFNRVSETVGAMAGKLGAFKPAGAKGDRTEGIFRDSLVENVRELVDILPGLNITGDPRLSATIERMRELCRYDAEALREDSGIRKETADKAAAIVADVAAYFA